MDWLCWFFLESPAALGAAAFFANFWLLVHWRRGGRARPLLIGLATAAILLVAQAATVTRREQAAALLGRIERDLLAGRVNALTDALAPDFRTDTLDRDDFLEFARRRLKTIRVLELRRGPLAVEQSEHDQFTIAVEYAARISFSEYAGPLRTYWQIAFRRAADGWRILTIHPPRIEDRQVSSWENVRP